MIVVAGRSEMSWPEDGETDIAASYVDAAGRSDQGIAVARMRQELLKVL